MEDIKSLVTIFLQKKFHEREHIIDATYKLIYDYNNSDRKKTDYERTLKSICSDLGKEIPNQVLVYLLTLVDLPLDLADSDDTQLRPVIEKIKTLEEIQKTQNYLAESIKPHLEDCVAVRPATSAAAASEKDQRKPAARGRRRTLNRRSDFARGRIFNATSLLDLTAAAVIKNQNKLKKEYQKKFDRAWELVNSEQCAGAALQQCYDTLRDLNKKRKLLRNIENDNITEEMIVDLYQDTEIFLREKHVYDTVYTRFIQFVDSLVD